LVSSCLLPFPPHTYCRLFAIRDSHEPIHADPEATASHPEGVSKNPISGYPFLKSEKLVHLLQAGFQPRENPVIRDLIKNVIDDIYSDAKEKCTLYLERSWQAMIIPGKYQSPPHRRKIILLTQHAIRSARSPRGRRNILPFFKSFRNAAKLGRRVGRRCPGTVLYLIYVPLMNRFIIQLWRNPLYHQSDAKKYKAVNKPDLSHWFDVIVMSVKGATSAASIHSGGGACFLSKLQAIDSLVCNSDYDGGMYIPSFLSHFFTLSSW
jgi:hypothetical protein